MKLNGKWNLYMIESTGVVNCPEQLKDYKKISAEVPGNVEIDLIKAGLLPTDIYKGMNIKKAETFEGYEWWYETEFVTPKHTQDIFIRFYGVDCIAEYWVNGKIIGYSKNSLVEHEFNITEFLSDENCNNKLFVKISSATVYGNNISYDLYNIDSHPQPNADGIALRKPPHCWGWDIMPRAVSAGIWKDVEIYEQKPLRINQIHYRVLDVNEKEARIRFLWELEIDDKLLNKDIYVDINGKCNNSEFKIHEKVYFKLGKAEIYIEQPNLWWPKGYGEANLYLTKCTLYMNDVVYDEKFLNVGVRTSRLERTMTTDGINGKFKFIINGIEVMCKGTNWVPLDVYHSRDKERYERAFGLLSDINCNMVRCWGGNVYEDDCFYDFCDKNGIMIWQDFAMACAGYSQHEEFYNQIEEEAVKVVRRLRTHPSIVLWSGDNECDAVLSEFGNDPTKNVITREILPKVIQNNDMGRDYLASSPCFNEETYKSNNYGILSEYHLWGPRDYFKSDYYKESKAHFVSEIGYHGCPCKESLQKFIDKECLWPYKDNEQWNLHSSDQRNNPARVELVANQIYQFFGEIPDNIDDFILASQISQAEAKKYFIERIRYAKPVKSGIIWWNLLDGWPQISDAVVDYYFNKKLAYNYIKASQQDFIIMANEIENWNIKIIASNDTNKPIKGKVTITEYERKEVIFSGNFETDANSNSVITQIPVMYSDKKLLIFEWDAENNSGKNHYVTGYPAFSFEKYKEDWLPEISRIQKKIK